MRRARSLFGLNLVRNGENHKFLLTLKQIFGKIKLVCKGGIPISVPIESECFRTSVSEMEGYTELRNKYVKYLWQARRCVFSEK
jgi:hypothetical protein